MLNSILRRLALAFCLLSATPAFAQVSCLSKVSNTDLAAEVSRRLGGTTDASGPIAGRVEVTASCNGYTMTIETFNSLSGNQQTATLYTASTSDCATFAQAINRKSSKLEQGGRVASCNGYTMTLVSITVSGEIKESTKYATSSGDCASQAALINN